MYARRRRLIIRLLLLFRQMMAVMFFSQHLVLSFRIDSPRHLFGARRVEHTEMMWYAVCLCAPHSQLQEGARTHLCMDDQKRQRQFASD